MSEQDQDRDRIFGSDEGETPEDVDAHQHAVRSADEDGGDDVEAHQHAVRSANDDGDDDVEAHQLSGR
jgi:hypothetical protein